MAENVFPARPILESYWVIPGQLLAGEHPGLVYSNELPRKRLNTFLHLGFNTFIDLTCAGEVDDYEPILQEQAGFLKIEIECFHFPIVDFGLPSRQDMTRILDQIDRALGSSRRVYLHCYGGIGRTGTSVGCFLVRHGLTGQQALQQLAVWWRDVPKSARFPQSPETTNQMEFVRKWPPG
jgi:hypothetical protein